MKDSPSVVEDIKSAIREGQRDRRSYQTSMIMILRKRCDHLSRNYYETGTRILELANATYGLYLEQTTEEKAKLFRELLSNLTFTRGTLCPTYNKPFDILTAGARF